MRHPGNTVVPMVNPTHKTYKSSKTSRSYYFKLKRKMIMQQKIFFLLFTLSLLSCSKPNIEPFLGVWQSTDPSWQMQLEITSKSLNYTSLVLQNEVFQKESFPILSVIQEKGETIINSEKSNLFIRKTTNGIETLNIPKHLKSNTDHYLKKRKWNKWTKLNQ